MASELAERPSFYKATIDDLNSVEYLLAFIIKNPVLDYLGLCSRNKAVLIFSIRAVSDIESRQIYASRIAADYDAQKMITAINLKGQDNVVDRCCGIAKKMSTLLQI